MANYFGKAEGTAQAIIKAFEEGRVPKAMGNVFIEDASEKHSASYSYLNRFIVAIHGYSDAMGMKQWNKKHQRWVKKGEKAFYILAPVLKKVEDKTTDEERKICIGFKGVQVFGLEQTTGPEIKQGEEAQRHLNELPLREVAEKWGLSINAYNGQEDGALGVYSMGNSISVGTKNLSTWAHELAHAADDKNGNLKSRKSDDRALAEVVAELAGAVLLECIGKPQEADRGGAYEYIKTWAERVNMKPVDACRKVLTRVVDAVSLILEEAGIKEEEKAVA
jgi:hypothetical protein